MYIEGTGLEYECESYDGDFDYWVEMPNGFVLEIWYTIDYGIVTGINAWYW